MQYNEPYTKTTIEIPKALLKRVKRRCLENDTTIKDVITRLLIRWVAKEEKAWDFLPH